MSLINKMLKELDRRHAGHQVGDADSGAQDVLNALRPVKERRLGSEMFWWILATMMLAMVAWLSWVMWQMMPRPIVTDKTLPVMARPATVNVGAGGLPATAPAPPVNAPAVAEQPAVPTSPPPTPPVAAPIRTVPANAAKSETTAAKPDILKLATEIATPIPERRVRVVPTAPKEASSPAQKPIAPAQDAGKVPGAATPARSVAPPAMQTLPQIAAVKPAPADTPAPPRSATPVVEPRIDRQASGRPADVAETLYRRAVGFINQGRVSEGIEELRGALGADPRHDSARQTLVALLLEQKRSEEAAGFLQQGLAVSPSNSGFTMLLARIMVEHQDVPGALSLLQKYAAAGAGNADYRAFTAALLQQQSRHKEAVDEYLAALRVAPQAGVWWVGLAISQEAMEKKSDAFESFQRARATRSLSPDVAAYAEQRVRQLQPAQ